ncbi:MAG TPA: S8 family serine peptidase, partial [Kiritimatiellia bacterium]|nr:S8 family serine peptidase [Kiritimatiellia bacterium]
DVIYVHIDKKKKFPATALLRAFGHGHNADILRLFVDAGVRVRLDPAVTARVTVDMRDEDMQAALARLLDPLGYVLTWTVVQGPLGPWPRLAEIQVFQPGRRELAEPLPGRPDQLAVAQDTNGAWVVKDEILLSFRAGGSREEAERLLAQYGGILLDGIPELGIYRVRFPPGSNVPALVAQLGQSPLVRAAEPHYAAALPPPARLNADSSAAGAAPQPGLPADGAAAVAILDTGLLKDAGLASLEAGRYDALNPGRELDDRQGHGTQMALIAAGMVAPAGAPASGEGVPVLAVRAFDDNGYASSFSLMSAMTYAASNGARVVNLSWGTPAESGFLAAAVAWVQAQGLVVVASAGNEPTGRPLYPAACAGVVAVAALDSEGQPWESSNYGEFISVAAAGTATLPVGYRGPPGGYAGTSIASAWVARQLALYRARHPEATPAQAVRALRQAVAPDGGAKDARLGYGRLDDAALSRLLPPDSRPKKLLFAPEK